MYYLLLAPKAVGVMSIRRVAMVASKPPGHQACPAIRLYSQLLCQELLMTECVHNPHMPKLLQMAQQAGCKTVDGYGMLLWQGAEQFKLWTGKDFPLEYVKQVMGFEA